tara:strand:- start:527 stop:655 length:129 start_codon:yes stop_codon:yes gene_type:complete
MTSVATPFFEAIGKTGYFGVGHKYPTIIKKTWVFNKILYDFD